jgi:hypothetical protein
MRLAAIQVWQLLSRGRDVITTLSDFANYTLGLSVLRPVIEQAMTGLAVDAVTSLGEPRRAQRIAEEEKEKYKQKLRAPAQQQTASTQQDAIVAMMRSMHAARASQPAAQEAKYWERKEEKEARAKVDEANEVPAAATAPKASPQTSGGNDGPPVMWTDGLLSPKTTPATPTTTSLLTTPASAAALPARASDGQQLVVRRLDLASLDLPLDGFVNEDIVALVVLHSGNSPDKRIEDLMYHALKRLEKRSLFFLNNGLGLLPFCLVSLIAVTSKGHRSTAHCTTPLPTARTAVYPSHCLRHALRLLCCRLRAHKLKRGMEYAVIPAAVGKLHHKDLSALLDLIRPTVIAVHARGGAGDAMGTARVEDAVELLAHVNKRQLTRVVKVSDLWTFAALEARGPISALSMC